MTRSPTAESLPKTPRAPTEKARQHAGFLPCVKLLAKLLPTGLPNGSATPSTQATPS